VWCAVTITATGADHSWWLVPLALTSRRRGERSETWYRPAGSWTENAPALLVRTRAPGHSGHPRPPCLLDRVAGDAAGVSLKTSSQRDGLYMALRLAAFRLAAS